MITTKEYLESLKSQKNALMSHLNKTHLFAGESESFNVLIDKVKSIIDTPRIEVAYNSSGGITKARLFGLKSITNRLFYKQPLTTAELYDCDIEIIDEYAFAETSLNSFTIPESVTKIGNYAFCETFVSVLNIPKNVKEIGSYAYRGTRIKTLNIPSNVEKIGSSAFLECGSLKSITLPDTPVTLGSNIFGWCGITTFDFPEWLTDIPSQMFYCCKSLRLSSLPSTIKSIGNGAFQATPCTFTEVPNSVTKIGYDAFVGMSATSMKIPSSVTSLGTTLFASSAAVEKLYLYCSCNVPNSVITDTINGNSRLKYVEIGAPGISKSAFKGGTGLLKVWIRETCTTIEADTNYYPFVGNRNVVIYAEADSKPNGWSNEFNKLATGVYASVIYGVKESPF